MDPNSQQTGIAAGSDQWCGSDKIKNLCISRENVNMFILPL